MNSGGHIPLLAKEGRPLASDGSECVLKHLRVSDHPVCGASVASRLFINAAATPPHEEGNAPRLTRYKTIHQVSCPWCLQPRSEEYSLGGRNAKRRVVLKETTWLCHLCS